MFYSCKSAQDQGTLYVARNFLNVRDLPVDPMKDVNAATNFLWKYTDAMILGACLKTFQMTNFVDEPKIDDALNCLAAQAKADLLLKTVIV